VGRLAQKPVSIFDNISHSVFEHHHEPDMVPKACADTLEKLGVEYLDLYLMHWPSAIKPGERNSAGLSTEWALNSKGKPDTDYKLSEDRMLEDVFGSFYC